MNQWGEQSKRRGNFPRRAALAATLGMMIGFAALLSIELQVSYSQQSEAVRRESENLAIVIESDILSAISKIDVVLGEAVHAFSPSVGGGQRRDVLEANRELLRLMTHIPEAQNCSLRVIDATGRVVYNAGATDTLPQVVVEDRAYFLRQKDDPLAGLVISEPLVSRFTGVWLITLSRRINGPDGRFAGLVQAALPTGFFQGLFELVHLGPQDSISLFDLDMRLLSRKPMLPDQLGKQYILPRAAEELAAGHTHGSYRAVSPVDKIERQIVHRKVGSTPYIIIIGRPPKVFMAAWWRKAYLYGLGYLGLASALAGFLVVVGRHQNELERLASVDELTGLANRRIFDGALEFSLKLRRRNRRPLTLMLLDLDHFKRINDTLGHLKGDLVLCRVVGVIKRNLRETDLPCRWGGEEFIALMDGCDLARASEIAETIRLAVEAEPMSEPDDGLRITISIGMAEANDDDGPDSVIARADQALYQAKESGRNGIWPSVGTSSVISAPYQAG